MNDTKTAQSNFAFGFRLLELKRELKSALDSSGKRGLKDLICACVASGIDTCADIKDTVEAIGGAHYGDYIVNQLGDAEVDGWLYYSDCDSEIYSLPSLF